MGGLNSALPLLSQGGIGLLAAPDVEIVDSIGVTYRLLDVLARQATASDAIHVGPTLTAFYGAVVVEKLAIALTQGGTFAYNLTASDRVRLADVLNIGVPASLTDGVGVALTQQAQQAVQVIEALRLQPVIAPMMLYGRSIADTIKIAVALGQFFGADLSDTIAVSPLLSGYAAKGGLIAETIGVAETVTPQLILRVTATDTLHIDDVSILNMIYDGQLADGVDIVAGYVSPDGQFTTWVMNTRTAAVTEYTNYAFNSFAQLGDAYLGASSAGLYKLVGDDDAGTSIIADIKSGFAQWAGTKLTMIKDVYLGLRGAGNYVLKILTADGKTYIYAVNAKDAATTRITVGKGLRARYWAFELISTGQDFDLDTVEFKPVVADRRV